MGEWTSASIKIGGRIRRADAEQLVAQINSWDLKIGYEVPVTIDNVASKGAVFAGSVNYGNLDDLTTFCDSLGLDWEHWCDSGGDWSAHIKRNVAGHRDMLDCNSDEVPMIPLRDLATPEALVSGWAKLHDRIKAWAVPVPPLVIVRRDGR